MNIKLTKGLFFKALLVYVLIVGVFFIPTISNYISAGAKYSPNFDVKKTSVKTPTVSQQEVITGYPVELSIPRLNIKLKIITGIYDPNTKTWLLTDDKAQFADVTSLPNNLSGNTLIYGHDIEQVFYPTRNLLSGDQLFILTSNNHIFEYTYTSSINTNPSDTSIFSYQGAPQVTLLTCNGWLSSYRRLMYFKFVKIDQ